MSKYVIWYDKKWVSGLSRSFEVIFTKIEKLHVFDDCMIFCQKYLIWPWMTRDKIRKNFVFIISNYIFTHVFMTQATLNHRKRFFGRNLRFDLKWLLLTLRFWELRCRVEWCSTNILKFINFPLLKFYLTKYRSC